MEIEEINDDVKDALGELANMLAGSIKTSLADDGKEIKLSIPSAICGEEYTVDCFVEGHWAGIPFHADGGEFLVECHLQKQP
jgi:chemotaxis protein CheX